MAVPSTAKVETIENADNQIKLRKKQRKAFKPCGIKEFANYFLIIMTDNISQHNKDPLSLHWKRRDSSAQSCRSPGQPLRPLAQLGRHSENTYAPSAVRGLHRINKCC